ncbi:MAG: type IV pilus modification protein PilV, partial [Pseudomonadota bacterium]
RGFTLVEVLIALIVLSVGMLGIAGLYLHSIQAGRTSVFRHQAINLAGDIADRIRANPTAGVNYQAAGKDNSCMTGTVSCTPLQMAENDIDIWDDQASAALPGGQVAIAFTDNGTAGPDTYQITLSWTEAGQTPPPSYSITIPVNDF